MRFARLSGLAVTVTVLALAQVRSQEPQSQGESARAAEGLVLTTAETLEFETTEVTWPSLLLLTTRWRSANAATWARWVTTIT